MNRFIKYLGISLAVIAIGLVLWFFKNIVAYILISAVLALIGRPLVDTLNKIKIRDHTFPKGLSAALVLILFWAFFYFFFRVYLPLIAKQAAELSHINVQSVIEDLKQPINAVEAFWDKYNIGGEKNITFQQFISGKITSALNFNIFTNAFSSLTSLIENIFISVFSISFITFFFLKDKNLFSDGIMAFVPLKYEEAFSKVLNSIHKLLIRYFIGIVCEISCIITLVTFGLTMVGVGFDHSLVIGLLAGIINVIPYVGPVIGTTFGILMTIITHLNYDYATQLLPLIGYCLLVFIAVHVIDNILFQPLIYSSSVHAHPLEIFLVILIAGSMAGIIGMILAVPSYTILRVFAKEFFNNFKVVKKLTEKI
ncbi:MAG: AI-2E family transporter [Bacteroidota bacterium]|nr:AI-2E family transporter [Bacteroidota bacterium]MDP4275325.1 AI-2E family transporter [Bacteroidota bacterium]